MTKLTEGRAEEPIIEPDLEITDAHHHFFPKGRHWWVRDYSLDDFLEDTGSGHRVTNSIWMEARGATSLSSLDEVTYVTEIARESERRGGIVIRGMVGDFNLRHGAAAGEGLDRLVEASEGRFVGVRQSSVWDPSPEVTTYLTDPEEGLLLRPYFQAGFAELARRDLSFDAWVYHPQLPEVAALADAFPETRIIVDHFGGPVKLGPYGTNREATLAVWRRNMSELQKRPNVFVKLGGLGLTDFVERVDVTGDPGVAPTSAQLADYWRNEVRWCIETFGAERCMFETNYPVDGVMCSYPVLWNAFKRMVSDASPDEKRALFAGTAHRAYGLNI